MKRAGHIKRPNAEGYVVKQIPFADVPFLKLNSAENYCDMMGLPPDEEHLVYDPYAARQQAFNLLRNAEYEEKRLEKVAKRTVQALDSLKKCREALPKKETPVDAVAEEVLDDRIWEEIGKFNGISAARQNIGERRYELWLLSRLSLPPRGNA